MNARRPSSRRGFTLLEMVIGVAMLAMVSLSIYRFVELNIVAVYASQQFTAAEAELQAVVAVVQAELNSLPPYRSGAIQGEAHMFSEKSADEMTWVTTAGPGLFTRHASGEYNVTLTVRKPEGVQRQDLGIRRVRAVDVNTGLMLGGAGGDDQDPWLPLIANVSQLEIRYFDARLNAWLEKWTDQASRPSLVRLRIWRETDEAPYEAILMLPRASQGGRALQQVESPGEQPPPPGPDRPVRPPPVQEGRIRR